MTISELIDKASAELVEEILTCEEGQPWFCVIRRKMERLAADLKERKQKHIEATNQTRPNENPHADLVNVQQVRAE